MHGQGFWGFGKLEFLWKGGAVGFGLLPGDSEVLGLPCSAVLSLVGIAAEIFFLAPELKCTLGICG